MNENTRKTRNDLAWLAQQPVNTKLAMLTEAQNIYQFLSQDLLEYFASQYAGQPYERGRTHSRYGTNPSSMVVKGERFPVEVPRLKDKQTGSVFNVPEFKKMQEIADPGERFLEALLCGLTSRKFESIVGQFIEGFGLSKSSVSRNFIEKSAQKLKELHSRKLDQENYVSIMIDGKSTLGDQVIIALGITDNGTKKVLGLVQAATENHRPVKDLLKNIINRGLKFKKGILVVIDGSKGLYKAAKETFGKHGFIQRCQWHKRENVLSYLPKKEHSYWKMKIQSAYEIHDYKEALSELKSMAKELEKINKSAANSLREGMKETLTLQKLRISKEFSRSFSTTNCIENLNGNIQRRIRNNTRWKNSDHLQRWMASACLDAEKNMRKIPGCKNLYKLAKALKREVKKNKISTF